MKEGHPPFEGRSPSFEGRPSFDPRVGYSLARSPATQRGDADTPVERIVRTRSIPNVTIERLQCDLRRLHHHLHTVDGLHAHDGSRRELVDLGRKARLIAAEIRHRGDLTAPPRPW